MCEQCKTEWARERDRFRDQVMLAVLPKLLDASAVRNLGDSMAVIADGATSSAWIVAAHAVIGRDAYVPEPVEGGSSDVV